MHQSLLSTHNHVGSGQRFMAGIHHQFCNRRILHLYFSPQAARGHCVSHAGQ